MLTQAITAQPSLEFAADVRGWLAANLDDVPAFATFDEEVDWGRRWQARLAEERWVGIHWPEEYGGRRRAGSPLQCLRHRGTSASAADGRGTRQRKR